MMKSAQSKKLLLSVAAISALWSGTAAANVDLTPTVDISNMYLYRGQNLGCAYGSCSNAQISGGVKASMGQFYGGVWGTSAADGEYDLYVGFNQELADKLSVDVSVWTYTYPHDDAFDTFGKYTEVFWTLIYDNYWATFVDNVAGDEGYMYFAVGGSYERFSATLGFADPDTTRHTITSFDQVFNDYVHLDLTYAATDNVKFTVSKILQQDEFELGTVEQEKFRDDDTLFQVVYSVPLK